MGVGVGELGVAVGVGVLGTGEGVGVAVDGCGVGVDGASWFGRAGVGVAGPAVEAPATVLPAGVAAGDAVVMGVPKLVGPVSLPSTSWAASTWLCGVPNTSSPAPPLPCNCCSNDGRRDEPVSVGAPGVPMRPVPFARQPVVTSRRIGRPAASKARRRGCRRARFMVRAYGRASAATIGRLRICGWGRP